jgi:hypothetical protein
VEISRGNNALMTSFNLVVFDRFARHRSWSFGCKAFRAMSHAKLG